MTRARTYLHRRPLITLAVCVLIATGCAERPRYIVRRSDADFQLAPDYRDLRRDLLAPGLERERALLAGDAGDASVWLSLGAFQLALGRPDSAEHCYRRAVEGFERNARALPRGTSEGYGTLRERADAYTALGAALAVRGDFGGARKSFERVDGPWIKPYRDVEREKARIARYSMGLSWELQGQPERALREYDPILARTEWTRARYARACARGALGQLDSALADFERVAQSGFPERRLAPYHAGRILEMQRDTVAAIAAYERFVELQTWGILLDSAYANARGDSTRAAMVAAAARAADLRTGGWYRDAVARIGRRRR